MTPEFVEIVKMSQEHEFKNRIDKSIMHSYFLNQFNNDFSLFVKKFNIEEGTLGPWVKNDVFKMLSNMDKDDKFIDKEI